MTPAERVVRAASDARRLCLSLRRAYVGPRALEQLRAGQAALMPADELHVGLGLAWASGDLELVRRALRQLPPERIDDDAVLATFRDAAMTGASTA